MKSKKNFCLTVVSALTFILLTHSSANAQENPLASAYFQNQYLINPAMAGAEKGLQLNAAYRHELTSGGNGNNTTNAITLDYQLGKMGLGLNVNMENEGLINANRYLLSYAYHLPFVNNSHLHFGLSAGISTEKFDLSDLIGDNDDLLVMQYNDLDPSFDADLGLGYTSGKWSLQAVLPNLRSVLQDDDLDRIYKPATFFAIASYKFKGQAGSLEPKVVYRGLKDFDNVVDLGVQVATPSQNFDAMVIYHSTNNLTAGIGYTHQENYQFQLSYVTPMNSNLQQRSSGNVQFGLKIRFMNKE